MSPTALLSRPYPAWVRLGLPLAGAAFALLLAYGAEYVLHLQPCALCLYERWPYWMVLVLSAVGFSAPSKTHTGILWGCVVILGGGILLTFYHVGVEMHLFPLPAFCSPLQTAASNLSALKAQVLAQPIVRCDMVAWRIIGVSATLWNALYGLGLAFVSGVLALHPERK